MTADPAITIKIAGKWRKYGLWKLVLWRRLWLKMSDADRRFCLSWARDKELMP